MFSIPHLVVIFVVALVVFGPEKLPELARNLGKVMAEFRRATGDLRSTFEGHLRDIEREADARRIAPAAAAAPLSSPPGTVASSPPNAAALAVEGAPVAESANSDAVNAASTSQIEQPNLGEIAPHEDPEAHFASLDPPEAIIKKPLPN